MGCLQTISGLSKFKNSIANRCRKHGHEMGAFKLVKPYLWVAQCKLCGEDIYINTAPDALIPVTGTIGARKCFGKCYHKEIRKFFFQV